MYSFQNRGEALLARQLKSSFSAPDYHLMNNVTLRTKNGTTHIDHILVSRFGIFVIETKAFNGWIFADPQRAVWTQVLFRVKFRFQNPIFQNFKHVCAVRDTLDFLPADAVISSVVFVGPAEFRTDVPSGVFSIDGLIDYIRHHSVTVLSPNRMQFCVGRLESSRLALTQQTDIDHVQDLRRRYGSKD